MRYEGLIAETIRIQGHQGDEIAAYLARPLSAGPLPGVVVIHHMPGFDAGSKEITRTFAANGYLAMCPNLHHREAPDASPEEASAAVRAAGGVPDERCVGDLDGALRHLRAMPQASGKVGVIGYCSGGRQAYIAACRLPFDAAVDCYGGRVVAAPEELTPAQPVAAIDMTPDLRCPLLGLFGAEDGNPSPAQVSRIEEELRAHGKTYEFHTYENAGHAFFAVDRPMYRVEAALDGWKRVWAFFAQHLAPAA
ncbi:MAG TPA: dienelactone hydrolase family protein [Candidatus Dormibacteraeota bacterium]|nr:dienelactone hydrolase family protein [Candidatus Dormibacteraeota bacterium]